MENVWYSANQSLLIIYKEGVLTRISKKDMIYMSQPCKPTAIQHWVNSTFEKKDEQFAYEYIQGFSKMITPKKIVNSWLINENPAFMLLENNDKEKIRFRFNEKYGNVMFSATEPENPEVAIEFERAVQYHLDKMCYEPFEVA
jgi:hypothetical protein